MSLLVTPWAALSHESFCKHYGCVSRCLQQSTGSHVHFSKVRNSPEQLVPEVPKQCPMEKGGQLWELGCLHRTGRAAAGWAAGMTILLDHNHLRHMWAACQGTHRKLSPFNYLECVRGVCRGGYHAEWRFRAPREYDHSTAKPWRAQDGKACVTQALSSGQLCSTFQEGASYPWPQFLGSKNIAYRYLLLLLHSLAAPPYAS